MCQKGTRLVLKFREAGVLLKEESHGDRVTKMSHVLCNSCYTTISAPHASELATPQTDFDCPHTERYRLRMPDLLVRCGIDLFSLQAPPIYLRIGV